MTGTCFWGDRGWACALVEGLGGTRDAPEGWHETRLSGPDPPVGQLRPPLDARGTRGC